MKGKVINIFNQKFNELIRRDKTYIGDVERYALFYIISTNDELFRSINEIYNFDEHVSKQMF